MAEETRKTGTKIETVEPIGDRVLIRKDEDKKQTKQGIHLPDKIEIPTITGRVVAISAKVERDADYPIKQYDKAAEAYNQIETAMKDETRYAKSRERGFTQYNLACCLSLAKRVDEALKALETSLQCGYNEWKWLEIDGDLNNVRSEPRFAELVKKYKDKGPEDDKEKKEEGKGGGEK